MAIYGNFLCKKRKTTRHFLLSFGASFGRESVKRSPNSKMLGRRQKTESKVSTFHAPFFRNFELKSPIFVLCPLN